MVWKPVNLTTPLLVLNVQAKNGKDGYANLKGRTIPDTPHIITPSGGLAYFFRPPNPQRYPSSFGTYVYPDDPPGFESLELRGAGGIQLVPSSRVDGKPYRFAAPWTELRADDLADLPDWLLELWITLDARAKNRPEIADERPRNSGHARKPVSTPVRPTDLSQHRDPTPIAIAIDPTPTTSSFPTALASTTPPTTPNYTTITTRLSVADIRVFVDGFDLWERECAEAVCLRAALEVESLDDGRSCLCRLPGHRESTPSAQWGRTETGFYIYKDHHARSRETVFTVPEVYAALVSGVVDTLPQPSRMAWRLRLMVEAGWLEPEPGAHASAA
jgi:Bifunctional DNA primase/polymerase, N-terminal